MAIASYRFLSHAARFDLYGGTTEEVVKGREVQKPFRQNQAFLLGTQEMKDNLVPYSIGDPTVLKLTSCSDVGLFRKLLSNFDMQRVNSQLQKMLSNGIGMKFTTAVTGHSLLHKAKRMAQNPSQWDVAYDLAFTGAVAFEPVIGIYVSLLLRYALYL